MEQVGEGSTDFHYSRPSNEIYVAYFIYPAFLFRPSIYRASWTLLAIPEIACKGYGIGLLTVRPWFESRQDHIFLPCNHTFLSLLRTLFVRIYITEANNSRCSALIGPIIELIQDLTVIYILTKVCADWLKFVDTRV